MSDKMPKEKAARKTRGFLSVRQLADIRELAIISRDTGVPLTLHGVIAGNQDTCSRTNAHTGSSTTTNTVHNGRKLPPKDAIGDACEKPSKQQRSANRREEFLAVKRVGVRWLPLVQMALRRSRATLRNDVWTERMRSKLALHEKMRAFFRRAWTRQICARRTDDSTYTSTEDLNVFGPSSFLDDEAIDAEEEEMLQAAIAASLTPAPADKPPHDDSALRAGCQLSPPLTPPGLRSQAPPAKTASKQSGKKSRKGKSSKPLQPANRG